MAVKIRLMRIGAKKRPFYRVVAVDERSKRTGGYLELLGTYNPLTEPKEITLKKDQIERWIKNGAVPSEGYLRILGEAPKRPARPPKKNQAKATPIQAEVQPTTQNKEEVVNTEASSEQAESESEEPTSQSENQETKGPEIENSSETRNSQNE